MGLTPDDIIEEVRTFLPNTNEAFPVTDAMLYLRMSDRQRRLFSIAAEESESYFGVRVTAPPDGNCVDLNDLEKDDEHAIASVDLIEIADPGSSAYLRNQEVTIVDADERFAGHFKPRVTIRSHLIEGVDEEVEDSGGRRIVNDLAGVAQLRVWYSRFPLPINGLGQVNGKMQEVEIGSPWDRLLIYDLVKSLIKSTARDDAEKNDPLWKMAHMAEEELVEEFKAHVKAFAGGTERITSR